MPAADRLPPLSALRAFEVAARHPNFSAAALELHVTPGAVSRQVGALEAQLGVELFVREARRNRSANCAPAASTWRSATARARACLMAPSICSMKSSCRWLTPRSG